MTGTLSAIERARGHARDGGRIDPGHHRVVTFEPDGRVHLLDVATLDEARQYAYDARHECEDDRGWPVVYVFDERLSLVDTGAPRGA